MDIQTVWLIVLSIATPVAGVVGFGIQLRQVKTARLENEKLQLEIEELRQKATQAESRIVHATNEEVQKITRGNTLFSRRTRDAAYARSKPTHEKSEVKNVLLALLLITLVVVIIGYLLYDLYRLFIWFKQA